ncbi:hypothetical protein PGS49_05210 [Yersinia intermedia]|uniref:hypothetical protein n=1 Tax=Yersinia intermedia TaxID=631 RepID=UPI000B6DECC4|nr:hypothetical protein [Yersinia intermedia]MCW8113922.1 hypothetical protein [Yersinia intermedia]MDA5480055.1 hypothetical protein [Yersinia intermedia]MDA5515582.1 hypothetical protein [Yersinia intermedia]OWF91976.1 hypothetical protein B4916_06235 [Yersinia intermedia]
MLKYAHLKFSSVEKKEKLSLIIGNNIIRISGRAGKWYTNIPINGYSKEEIKLDGNNELCELSFSKEKLYHPDQNIFDKKYKVRTHELQNELVYYSLSGNIDTPTGILITFPGVSNFDNVNYRLSAMTSLQEKLQDVLIIAFQDKEGVYGNYMFNTSNGYPIKPIAVSLISGLRERYNLKNNNLIFYGNSKGGSIALKYIDSFPESYFFVDIPQLDLYNYKSQNELMRFSIGENARKHYNFLDELPKIRNKRLTYSFAENDFDASRGIPMKLYPNIKVAMLKDMGHSGAAMELVKRQFCKIIQLITGNTAIIRPKTSARWNILHNKLFISRVLGSFNNETDMPKVYAEVEFSNTENSWSASLNKTFSGKIVVNWTTGFDVMTHLLPGDYNIYLHVYVNFKEFIYPLDKKIIVTSDNFILENLSENNM